MPANNLTATMQANTRELVKTAREQVGQLRDLPDLNPKQQDAVDTAYSLLVDLEDMLTQRELKSQIQALRAKAGELSNIITSMRKSIDELKRAAQAVDTAAKAVGALAEILAKASSAGIL
ncbi:MAG: hypothetical protein ACYDH9_16560 [Limisphaerales bacterium]